MLKRSDGRNNILRKSKSSDSGPKNPLKKIVKTLRGTISNSFETQHKDPPFVENFDFTTLDKLLEKFQQAIETEYKKHNIFIEIINHYLSFLQNKPYFNKILSDIDSTDRREIIKYIQLIVPIVNSLDNSKNILQYTYGCLAGLLSQLDHPDIFEKYLAQYLSYRDKQLSDYLNDFIQLQSIYTMEDVHNGFLKLNHELNQIIPALKNFMIHLSPDIAKIGAALDSIPPTKRNYFLPRKTPDKKPSKETLNDSLSKVRITNLQKTQLIQLFTKDDNFFFISRIADNSLIDFIKVHLVIFGLHFAIFDKDLLDNYLQIINNAQEAYYILQNLDTTKTRFLEYYKDDFAEIEKTLARYFDNLDLNLQKYYNEPLFSAENPIALSHQEQIMLHATTTANIK